MTFNLPAMIACSVNVVHKLRVVLCGQLLFVMAASSTWSQDLSHTKDTYFPADPHFRAGKLLYVDDFKHGMTQWRIEMERQNEASEIPGTITAKDGVLDIDVPRGATVWFRDELTSPVMISYEATMISAGGPNDHVSDLNCFWMATDPTAPENIFAHSRSGAFEEYNSLRTYYVGQGGNRNQSTRFRRYIGDHVKRPLLPENDFSAGRNPEKMLVPNKSQTVWLIADGNMIQYYRDRVRIFNYADPEPYSKGWFALRTTRNHMQIRNFQIIQLIPTTESVNSR